MPLSGHAFVESSVTLFGIADNGIFYASNQASLGSTKTARARFRHKPARWNAPEAYRPEKGIDIPIDWFERHTRLSTLLPLHIGV
ncbi:porin [Paraburkholderia panacisoli]|uniref:Porin n=1 Tax=Paraburkholderia panacisoli TaxID=2603818 RepID=A0A5B0H9E3_9BURK|nr:porin [Paraburkholderia panacisoli]